MLRGQHLEKALDVAYATFDLNARERKADLNLGDITPEADLIEPMLEQCAKWKPPGPLNATQLKIEYYFDPVPIPVIGYLDLAFESVDIDLKTTKACPSKPRPDNVRQVALYRAARNKAGGLLYVTDKRHSYFDVDDATMNEAIAELHADALSLNNFLARCETKDDALKSLPVDWSHFQAPKVKIPLNTLLAG